MQSISFSVNQYTISLRFKHSMHKYAIKFLSNMPTNSVNNKNLQSIEVVPIVLLYHAAIVHHSIARHHPCPWTDVCHGCWKLYVQWRVWRHANLYGPCPLVHHLVKLHLKHFPWPQWPTGQHDGIVEVIDSTGVQNNHKPAIYWQPYWLLVHHNNIWHILFLCWKVNQMQLVTSQSTSSI